MPINHKLPSRTNSRLDGHPYDSIHMLGLPDTEDFDDDTFGFTKEMAERRLKEYEDPNKNPVFAWSDQKHLNHLSRLDYADKEYIPDNADEAELKKNPTYPYYSKHKYEQSSLNLKNKISKNAHKPISNYVIFLNTLNQFSLSTDEMDVSEFPINDNNYYYVGMFASQLFLGNYDMLIVKSFLYRIIKDTQFKLNHDVFIMDEHRPSGKESMDYFYLKRHIKICDLKIELLGYKVIGKDERGNDIWDNCINIKGNIYAKKMEFIKEEWEKTPELFDSNINDDDDDNYEDVDSEDDEGKEALNFEFPFNKRDLVPYLTDEFAKWLSSNGMELRFNIEKLKNGTASQKTKSAEKAIRRMFPEGVKKIKDLFKKIPPTQPERIKQNINSILISLQNIENLYDTHGIPCRGEECKVSGGNRIKVKKAKKTKKGISNKKKRKTIRSKNNK
jgi:hypothetical protein